MSDTRLANLDSTTFFFINVVCEASHAGQKLSGARFVTHVPGVTRPWSSHCLRSVDTVLHRLGDGLIIDF